MAHMVVQSLFVRLFNSSTISRTQCLTLGMYYDFEEISERIYKSFGKTPSTHKLHLHPRDRECSDPVTENDFTQYVTWVNKAVDWREAEFRLPILYAHFEKKRRGRKRRRSSTDGVPATQFPVKALKTDTVAVQPSSSPSSPSTVPERGRSVQANCVYMFQTKDMFHSKKSLQVTLTTSSTCKAIVLAVRKDVHRAAMCSRRLRNVLSKIAFQVYHHGVALPLDAKILSGTEPSSISIKISLCMIEEGGLAKSLQEVKNADPPLSTKDKLNIYNERKQKYGGRLCEMDPLTTEDWKREMETFRKDTYQTGLKGSRGSLALPSGPLFCLLERDGHPGISDSPSAEIGRSSSSANDVGVSQTNSETVDEDDSWSETSSPDPGPRDSDDDDEYVGASKAVSKSLEPIAIGSERPRDTRPEYLGEIHQIFLECPARHRYNLDPNAFNKKGAFNKHYARYFRGIEDPRSVATYKHQITNRRFLKPFNLDGTRIWVGFDAPPPAGRQIQRVIISFTRASGTTPRYALYGMWERAITAGRAWIKLNNYHDTFLIGIPRANVSSRLTKFQDCENVIQTKQEVLANPPQIAEMVAVLDACRLCREVDVVVVGIDGLTTLLQNYSWLYKRYGSRLAINIVFVVPAWFPEPEHEGPKYFRTAANGIRYAEYTLADIDNGANGSGSAACKVLLHIFDIINEGKCHYEHREQHMSFTGGRAHFRVCPDSEISEGVRKEQLGTRTWRPLIDG